LFSWTKRSSPFVKEGGWWDLKEKTDRSDELDRSVGGTTLCHEIYMGVVSNRCLGRRDVT